MTFRYRLFGEGTGCPFVFIRNFLFIYSFKIFWSPTELFQFRENLLFRKGPLTLILWCVKGSLILRLSPPSSDDIESSSKSKETKMKDSPNKIVLHSAFRNVSVV